MYTAVIHAPNAHNDARNYHVHVIYHDRPAKFLEDRACWDFQVSETVKDASGKRRVRFPLRQPKVLAVTQSPAKSGDKDSGKNFIPHLRRNYACITNAVLKDRGHTKRYDPRPYVEMGIKRTPTEHLGKKDAALEAIGVSTQRGKRNAKSIWRDAEQAIDDQFEQATKEHAQSQNEYQNVLSVPMSCTVDDGSVHTLKSLIIEREAIVSTTLLDRRQLMHFDVLEAKAKSRAVKTRQTCSQLLKSVEDGTADKSTEATVTSLNMRFTQAQNHLDGIDAALKPFRVPIAAFADLVSIREARLTEIDEDAFKLAESIKARSAVKTHSHVVVDASGSGRSKDPTSVVLKRPVAPIIVGGEPIVPPTISPRIKPELVKIEAVEEDHAPFAETLRTVQPNRAPHTADPPAARNLSLAGNGASAESTSRQPDAHSAIVKQPSSDHQSSQRTQEIEHEEHLRQRRWLTASAELIRGNSQHRTETHSRQASAEHLSSVRKLSSGGVVRDESSEVRVFGSSPGDVGTRYDDANHDVQRTRSGDRQSGSDRLIVEHAALPPQRIAGLPIAVMQLPPQRVPGPPILSIPLPPQRVPGPTILTASLPPQKAPGPPIVSMPLPPQKRGAAVAHPPWAQGLTAVEQSPNPPANRKADEKIERREPPTVSKPSTEALVQPMSNKQRYAIWNTLVDRIHKERLIIVTAQKTEGETWLTVPRLDAADLAILHDPSFEDRCAKRLAGLKGEQRGELKRLERYINDQSYNPKTLVIADNKAKLAHLPKELKLLMDCYDGHKLLRAAFRKAADKRTATEGGLVDVAVGAKGQDGDLPLDVIARWKDVSGRG